MSSWHQISVACLTASGVRSGGFLEHTNPIEPSTWPIVALLQPRGSHMPHFYFDIDDGEHSSRGDVALEFADAQAARDNAVSALPDIARDVMPDGQQRDFFVTMRDESAGQSSKRACLYGPSG